MGKVAVVAMTEDKEFFLVVRRALLMVVRFIEKKYQLDKKEHVD